MMRTSARQYATDLRLATARPTAPRGLSYDEDTLELSWVRPAGAIPFTHYNVRLGSDAGEVSYRLPVGTTKLLVPRSALARITAWNEASQIEGDPAYLNVGSQIEWPDSSGSVYGIPLAYQVEYVLTSNLTITSPIPARPNRRLLIYVRQDATTRYNVSFDPASFVDSATAFIDLSFAITREYFGRADGKWYPIGPAFQFDPNA